MQGLEQKREQMQVGHGLSALLHLYTLGMAESSRSIAKAFLLRPSGRWRGSNSSLTLLVAALDPQS